VGKTKRMSVVIVTTILLVTSLLTACAHRVEFGVVRDTLANIERTKNGNWRVWLTNDTAAGYCTTNSALGEEALKLLKEHYGEVIIQYRDIRTGDPEWSAWSNSDCGSIYKGESSMKIFYIDSITPVPARLMASPGG